MLSVALSVHYSCLKSKIVLMNRSSQTMFIFVLLKNNHLSTVSVSITSSTRVKCKNEKICISTRLGYFFVTAILSSGFIFYSAFNLDF